MKKSRFSEEQIVAILREADQAPVTEVAKKHRVSEQAIYTWRKRFGTLQPADGQVPFLLEIRERDALFTTGAVRST